MSSFLLRRPVLNRYLSRTVVLAVILFPWVVYAGLSLLLFSKRTSFFIVFLWRRVVFFFWKFTTLLRVWPILSRFILSGLIGSILSRRIGVIVLLVTVFCWLFVSVFIEITSMMGVIFDWIRIPLSLFTPSIRFIFLISGWSLTLPMLAISWVLLAWIFIGLIVLARVLSWSIIVDFVQMSLLRILFFVIIVPGVISFCIAFLPFVIMWSLVWFLFISFLTIFPRWVISVIVVLTVTWNFVLSASLFWVFVAMLFVSASASGARWGGRALWFWLWIFFFLHILVFLIWGIVFSRRIILLLARPFIWPSLIGSIWILSLITVRLLRIWIFLCFLSVFLFLLFLFLLGPVNTLLSMLFLSFYL